MEILGIDVGGTGIKGALVDTAKGVMVTERYRLRTPQPATPKLMVETIKSIVSKFEWKGPIGCGFPAPIVHGKPHLASNISSKWMKLDIVKTFVDATGCHVAVANDADVAGLAEMRFGAGRNRSGLVIIVTLGTGIGSALFMDGRLVPNTELGHIEINGKEAEPWAAEIVREKKGLSWKKWAKRVNTYLERMQLYFWPELFIIGGGVSKKHEKFFPHLTVDCEVVPAQFRNEAGIIGAATLAAESLQPAAVRTEPASGGPGRERGQSAR